MRRVLVIGLDCAPPSLVFDRWRCSLPHLSALMERGTWGPLRSTVPPITVPAWTSMVSGRDPGELGLYGFRNRLAGRYDLRVATSRDVRVKRLWDWLGDHGRRVASLFVPLTWPPTPVRGQMVSCFLTPALDEPWTFPRGLGEALSERHGAYVPDVPELRSSEPDRVLRDLHGMAAQHFAMATDLWRESRPDFLMMVEMGPDRLHHALWQHIDPAHPRHRPDNPWLDRARRYYAFLDERIGALLAAAGEETAVLVVSDHGARAMEGGVRVNELLRQTGWLATRAEAPGQIDWARTRAWGEGGYYARLWLNVRGREPEGTVDPAEHAAERDRLAAQMEAMTGEDGASLGNVVVYPERIYRETRGVPPDLMVFFGGLRLRSLGTFGPDLFPAVNDTGPDGCNHDWEGILILAGGGAPARGRVDGLSIYDVCRTVLGLMDVPSPADLLGVDRSVA